MLTDPKALAAECSANRSIPRVYHLTNESSADSFIFYALGCQGSGKSPQKQVAELLEKIANNPDTRPAFVLFLGDNFYEFGLGSPIDPAVHSHFSAMYEGLHKLGIPCFILLGNHDLNYHRFNYLMTEQGEMRGNHQVAISYLPDDIYKTTEAKEALYQQSELNVKSLPLWNMPHRFYSLIKNDTQIFCLDSSRIVAEFIKAKTTPTDLTNQVNWLIKEMNSANRHKRKVIIAQHHPLFTCGKRFYGQDAAEYLDKKELTFIKKFFAIPENTPLPYHELLKKVYQDLGIHFDLLLAAHDHNLYYYNNKDEPHDFNIVEAVVGGGGGKLHDRYNFSHPESMGFFLKKHGIMRVECNAKQEAIRLAYLTTGIKSYELRFTTDCALPLRHFPHTIPDQECNEIQRLTYILKKSLEKYFHFIDKKQNASHGKFLSLSIPHGNVAHGNFGMDRAHELWALLHQYESENLEKLLSQMYRLCCLNTLPFNLLFPHHRQHSLITLINQGIAKEYGETMSLEQLYLDRCVATPDGLLLEHYQK